MNKKELIKIYGAARCHKSQYYIPYFSDRDLDFTFLDVEENEAFAEELRSLYESRKLNFPTIIIDGKKLRNPRDKEIEKQLLKREKMNNNIISKLEHDKKQQEFSLNVNGAKAFISYSMKDGVMYLNHTEVPSSLRGQGVGKKLVEQTFEFIQAEDIEAKAVCSYVQSVRSKNDKWKKVIS